MRWQGCSYGTVMALALGVGCKKDQPKPEPEPPPPAATTAALPHRPMGPNPMGMGRDPQVSKDYRADVCYYGTLPYRRVRDAYLGSLGKDEPSEKKLPSFGLPPLPGVTPPAASGAPSAGRPGASADPAASAAAAASPPVPPPHAGRRFDRSMPFERHTRMCSMLLPLKEPSMGDFDVQAAAYTPYVTGLAELVKEAMQYYQREDYKRDGFAKGKEYDKKLRAELAKLDEMQDKLGAALTAWRKDHPPDASKMDEGEKLARAMMDDARAAFLMVVMKKADGEAWKAALAKVEASNAALEAYRPGHEDDPWVKFVASPAGAFLKMAKEGKLTGDKTFENDAYFAFVNSYISIFDGRQRAATFAHMHPKTPGEAPSAAPAAPAAPAQKE